MTLAIISAAPAALAVRRTTLFPALFSIAFGALLVFGMGFAGPERLHNAAHDSRHSFAFPCH